MKSTILFFVQFFLVYWFGWLVCYYTKKREADQHIDYLARELHNYRVKVREYQIRYDMPVIKQS